MLKLLLNELKQSEKMRGIKGYKNMSEERLVSFINELESVKESEKTFDGERIEKIKKDFNKLREIFKTNHLNLLFKPKLKEIRKDRYRIEKIIKDIEKNLLKLEKSLSKKYHDYDDIDKKE